ncbi:RGG repeats nuclear RNA binding protein A-like [Rhodamnia argentea]|uniref:RGG repeats nuclear RNA binding protein A-like n=1 Tax=Rhodamnia argentea TaxID=178133 RepID=A0A8B8NRU7_9MYRT|nr:RGG repeats nuclear RNA binding protein A-like [Rhodamnia argentea]
MATMNPFDILGDDDNEDPSQLVAAAKPVEKPKKAPAQAAPPPKPAAKLPAKPLPPAEAVREAKSDTGRGRGRGGGRGYGRGFGRGGGRGYDQESGNSEGAAGSNDGFSGGFRASEEGDSGKLSERRGGPRGSFRGGRRGGFNNGEPGEGERPRRAFERRSGTGRGNEIKREGAGRGNWGTPTDEITPETEEPVVEVEKNVGSEKQLVDEDGTDASKENPVNEPEEKEPEDKEMTLEEYEKVLEEKRKALLALKAEERKVEVDKELKSMQQLSSKKDNNEVFVKLGSEKDKRKEAAEKEERAKKSVSINEFLKPAEGEKFYNPGGRGRGRGRGRGSTGGYGGGYARDVAAPSIEDPGQFPSLGGK